MSRPINPDMKHEATRALRRMILSCCADLYPRPTMLSTLRWLCAEHITDDDELEREIHYLSGHGWLRTAEIKVIGRVDTKIDLTSQGYDVAKGIDPKEPIL